MLKMLKILLIYYRKTVEKVFYTIPAAKMLNSVVDGTNICKVFKGWCHLQQEMKC